MLDKYLRDIDPYFSAYETKQKNNLELKSAELNNEFESKSAELYSSWLELIWYQRTLTYGRYIAVIFFDPFVTTSPKNPNGFGPLVFNEVKLSDIKKLINAPSVGREYLDNWAFGNKPIEFLEAIHEQQEAFNDVREILKDIPNINKEDIKTHFESGQKTKELLDKYPDLIETIEEIDFEKIDIDIEKLLYYKELVDKGNMDLYFLGKRILFDIEDIFAINFNKRIGFKLLSSLTGGILGPNQYYRFRFFMKGIKETLQKDEFGERGGLKGLEKTFERILRSKNPFFKGKFSRERLIIYKNARDKVKGHFNDKKLAKQFVINNRKEINLKDKQWKSGKIKGEGFSTKTSREWKWRKVAKKTIRFIKVLFI